MAVKQKNGSVLVGADTCVTVGTRKMTMVNESKIHAFDVPGGNGGVMVIAGAGELRTAYEVENIEFPKHKRGLLAIEYLRKLFIPIWRDSITRIGARGKTEDDVEYINSTLLVVYHDRIFTIDHYMCVLESDHPYAVIGSGDEIALGYLYALYESAPDSAESLILSTLAAAARFDSGTGGPYHVIDCTNGMWLNGLSPSK